MAKVGLPYDVDSVRQQWAGKRTKPVWGRYPVEFDPIRRHCHMVEDTNPLFLDPQSDEAMGRGGVIAPPVMVEYFAGQGVWPPSEGGPRLMMEVPTPGDRFINMGNELEFLQPVMVGDQLSSYVEITDVFVKPIQLDPLATWIVTETHFLNQDGDDVAIGRNTLLIHRTPEEVAASEETTS